MLMNIHGIVYNYPHATSKFFFITKSITQDVSQSLFVLLMHYPPSPHHDKHSLLPRRSRSCLPTLPCHRLWTQLQAAAPCPPSRWSPLSVLWLWWLRWLALQFTCAAAQWGANWGRNEPCSWRWRRWRAPEQVSQMRKQEGAIRQTEKLGLCDAHQTL